PRALLRTLPALFIFGVRRLAVERAGCAGPFRLRRARLLGTLAALFFERPALYRPALFGRAQHLLGHLIRLALVFVLRRADLQLGLHEPADGAVADGALQAQDFLLREGGAGGRGRLGRALRRRAAFGLFLRRLASLVLREVGIISLRSLLAFVGHKRFP